KLQHRETRRKRITSYLVSNGFYETYHLSFVKEAENLLLDPHQSGVKVMNPLSAELEFMRTSTLIGGLKSVAHNLNRQQNDVKLFKWGSIFNLEEENIVEKKTLSFWMTGNNNESNWHTNASKSDFFFAKAFVENAMKLGNTKNYTTEAFSGNSIYAYGLNYISKGEIVATVGLVSKNILKETDIAQEVFFGEIDAKFLLESGKTETQYSAISKFPKVERDLSLVVPQQVNYGQIRETVNKLNSRLIKKFYIFDVYQGEQVKEGFKSYAIRLEFEDKSKTLEDKTIDKLMQSLSSSLETDLNVEIRK
ncbi:MAG: hypothetical protein EOP53_26295, partial [Sphingobacteriales bacterium]